MSDEKPDKQSPQTQISARQKAEEKGWRVVDGGIDSDKKPEQKFPIVDINAPSAPTEMIIGSDGKDKKRDFTDFLLISPPKTPLKEQKIPLKNSGLKSFTDDDGVTYFLPDSEANETQNKPSQIIEHSLKEDLYKDGEAGWTVNVADAGFYRRVLKGKAEYEGAQAIVERIVTDGRCEWQSHVFIDTQGNDLIVQVTKKLFDERVKFECNTATNQEKNREK